MAERANQPQPHTNQSQRSRPARYDIPCLDHPFWAADLARLRVAVQIIQQALQYSVRYASPAKDCALLNKTHRNRPSPRNDRPSQPSTHFRGHPPIRPSHHAVLRLRPPVAPVAPVAPAFHGRHSSARPNTSIAPPRHPCACLKRAPHNHPNLRHPLRPSAVLPRKRLLSAGARRLLQLRAALAGDGCRRCLPPPRAGGGAGGRQGGVQDDPGLAAAPGDDVDPLRAVAVRRLAGLAVAVDPQRRAGEAQGAGEEQGHAAALCDCQHAARDHVCVYIRGYGEYLHAGGKAVSGTPFVCRLGAYRGYDYYRRDGAVHAEGR